MAWENLSTDVVEEFELAQEDRDLVLEAGYAISNDRMKKAHREVARMSQARKRAKEKYEAKHGEVSTITKQQLLIQSLERQARRRAKVKKAKVTK